MLLPQKLLLLNVVKTEPLTFGSIVNFDALIPQLFEKPPISPPTRADIWQQLQIAIQHQYTCIFVATREEDLECPISLLELDKHQDSVVTVDGHIYAKEALTQWLSRKSDNESPFRQKLTATDVLHCKVMSLQAYQQFLNENKQITPLIFSKKASYQTFKQKELEVSVGCLSCFKFKFS